MLKLVWTKLVFRIFYSKGSIRGRTLPLKFLSTSLNLRRFSSMIFSRNARSWKPVFIFRQCSWFKMFSVVRRILWQSATVQNELIYRWLCCQPPISVVNIAKHGCTVCAEIDMSASFTATRAAQSSLGTVRKWNSASLEFANQNSTNLSLVINCFEEGHIWDNYDGYIRKDTRLPVLCGVQRNK